MDGPALDAALEVFFFVWFLTWGFFCVAGAMLLSRHDQGTLGFVYALFLGLGPLGVLMAFLKAENIDAAKRDKQLLELVRHALTTREADLSRGVAAGLKAHLREEEAGQPVVAPAVDPAPPAPRPRSYEEIVASEPPKPRRFR
jgi:hypothetical protein